MDRTDSIDRRKPVKMDYSLANSFRHVFHTLDFKKEGTLNLTQLQVICANICRVLDIAFVPEDLEKFNLGSKTLEPTGFIDYVHRLVKLTNGKY